MISKDSLYHFVGIKGSGMSALALILDGEGYRVQGSDIEKYFFTQQGLEEAQIPMMPFSADNIQPGLTLSLIHISEPTRREWLSRMPSSA